MNLLKSIPVSLSVFESAATTELSAGWLVSPDILLNAVSTMSTPASAAIRTVATPFPVVSCVWRCTGIEISFLSAVISFLAA